MMCLGRARLRRHPLTLAPRSSRVVQLRTGWPAWPAQEFRMVTEGTMKERSRFGFDSSNGARTQFSIIHELSSSWCG
jgi:hypothetical protein